jgi:hypothetical protein
LCEKQYAKQDSISYGPQKLFSDGVGFILPFSIMNSLTYPCFVSASRDNLHHQVSIGSPYFAAKFGTSDLISVGFCIPLRSCHLQSRPARYVTQLKWPRSTPSAVHRSVFEKTTVNPHILIEYGAISGRVASFACLSLRSLC